mgnify:CR=1 FL=1
MTIEYPSPEMILAGEVCHDAFQNAEHTKAEKKRRAGQTRPQGRNGYGAWQKIVKKGGIGIYRPCEKENR